MIVYRELSTLENDLGIPAGVLYAVSNTLSSHYRTVKIPKKDGGFRTLRVPDRLLSHIQRRIYRVLLISRPVSAYGVAYRPGTSLVSGAGRHCASFRRKNAAVCRDVAPGSTPESTPESAPETVCPESGQAFWGASLLKLDIRDFFDSILWAHVKEYAFPAEIFSEPLRVLLTNLCYDGDRLPQGAPTSPAISNLVMADFDAELGAFCESRGIVYTRYSDDMCFSGAVEPGVILPLVQGLLRQKGMFLNHRKTAFIPCGHRQTVTGLVVGERPSVPRKIRRTLRQELYYIRKYSLEDHLRTLGFPCSPAEYRRHLLGRIAFVLSVHPEDTALLQAKAWLLRQPEPDK